MEYLSDPDPRPYPWHRVYSALIFVLGFALAVYALLDFARPSFGLISFSFLVILPFALNALLVYLADPWKEMTTRQYLGVSAGFFVAVIVCSIVFLREGTVCVVMLAPIWMACGVAGVLTTRWVRHRITNDRQYCFGLIGLPLAAMLIEPMIALPVERGTVTRSTVIQSSPDQLWPLLRGIPNVRAGEGRWNVSQDVIGIPRPVGARMIGQGIGAQRYAEWGSGIRFREQIIDWRPGRSIGWTFHFDRFDDWQMTDRHLLPDSPHFKVTKGGYRIEPLPGGRSRVTIHTSYLIATPVNPYAKMWGELFLGDLENNLLALIEQRASTQPTLGGSLAAG